MLRLINLEEIQNSIQSISKLADLHTEKDIRFLAEVKSWLIEIERVLRDNKIPAGGKIASLRADVVSAEMGIAPIGFHSADQISKSKLRNTVAMQCAQKAVDIVFSVIQKDIDRISEAERIMSQLISVAKSKRLLGDFPNPPITTDILKSFWNRFSNDEDLSPGVVSIEGLVGPYDSLIIFDRISKLH